MGITGCPRVAGGDGSVIVGRGGRLVDFRDGLRKENA